MKRIVFFILGLCLNVVICVAQTVVSGDISGTWTRSNSPYIVTEMVKIQNDNTLEIQAGVIVRFYGGAGFVVEGVLRAQGAEGDSVVFTHFADHPDSTWNGIWFSEGDAKSTFDYCVIEHSESEKGGGLYIFQTPVEINHSLLANNKTDARGGAIYCAESVFIDVIFPLTIRNTTFTGNRAQGSGGAISCYRMHGVSGLGQKSIYIKNCIFEKNNSSYAGGAIDIDDGHNTELFIYHSEFNENSANAGGALAICGTRYVLQNSILKNNRASHGGDAIYSQSKGYIINSVIYNSVPTEKAVTTRFDYPINAVNSIFYHSDFSVFNADEPNISVSYSCGSNNRPGTGNIDVDPQFVDAENGDFRLAGSSPCRHTGDPAVLFNNNDGSRNHMGIEGGSGIFVCPFQLDFGPLGIGQMVSKKYTFINFRNAAITINAADLSDDQNFTLLTQFPLTVQPTAHDTISVVFQPQVSGTLASTVSLFSPELVTQPVVLDLAGLGNVWIGKVSGTWEKAKSPYIIGGTITVPEDKKLFVESGVNVMIDPVIAGDDVQIIVEGSFIAQGTKNDSIVFSVLSEHAKPGAWKGIHFTPPRDTREEYLGKEFTMQWCRVSWARTGLDLATEAPIIEHCRVNGCSEDGIRWTGSYEFFDERHGSISFNKLYHNEGFGLVCSADCASRDGWTHPNIFKNTISGNRLGGIYLHAEGGRSGSTNLFLRTNEAYLRPVIKNNFISHNKGYAIDCFSDGHYNTVMSSIKHYSEAYLEPVITENVVIENENAFRMRSDMFEDVELSFSDIVLFQNTFYSNSGNQITASDSLSMVDIRNNIFWNYTGQSTVFDDVPKIRTSYNNFQYAVDGNGNISSNPLFVGPNSGDFRLQYLSPCIDTGDPDSPGDPDSTRADMGAQYYHQSISPFSLVSPINDTVVVDSTPAFRWEQPQTAGGEPLVFDLLYSKNKNFKDAKRENDITTTSFYLEEPLDDYTTYYWKVLAKNPWDLERASAENWHFSVNTDTIPPYWTMDLPLIEFNEDDSLFLPVQFWYDYVEDKKCADSTLDYRVLPGEYITASMRNDTLFLQAPQNWFGTDTLHLEITDKSQLTIRADMAAKVNSVNDPPVFSGLPESIRFANDSEYVLDLSKRVTDIDSPDSLLTILPECGSDSIFIHKETGSVFKLTSVPDFSGDEMLSIRAFDDYNDSSVVSIPVTVDFPAGLNIFKDRFPSKYELYPNFPNPFNARTTIPFSLPEKSNVRILIYNLQGELVTVLYNGTKSAGHYVLVWNANFYSSGTYFIKMTTDKYTCVKKCILLK